MADWKKVVVSGSAISQLDNDANYLSTTGGGILSASLEGDAQGQIKLNGVNINANALGTTDSPTFASVTASLQGNVVGDLTGDVTGDLTGNSAGVHTGAVTGSVLGNITGNVTGNLTGNSAGVHTGDVTGSVLGNITGNVTGNVTGDLSGDVTGDVTGNLTGTADTASNVAFDNVVSLTAVSTSFDTRIAELETGTYELGFQGDSGTGTILNSETFDIAGGTNITTTANANDLSVALDADISLTSVTASINGNVVGNLTGDVTGDVTGDLTGNADTATTVAASSTGQGKVSVGSNANIGLGVEASDSPTFASLTLTGDLTVQGATTTLNTANLNVEDQFILINSGGSAADAGIVTNAGESFGWDQSEGRWAFDFTGGTFDQSTIGADAYAAAVVTTDDANYQKNGNIRIDGTDIFIYVE